MRRKNKLCVAIFLTLLSLNITSLIIKGSQASEPQDIEFEVIDCGDISGYGEETYLVVKTETEWANVWEKHTRPYLAATAYPKMNFSKNMVVCAFMGERPTTGYSVSLQRIWTEEERMVVKIDKRNPPENFMVSEVITYPYVIASLQRTDLEIVFNITEEDGTINEYILPEFTIMAFILTAFIVISTAIVVLTRKT
jgi:hypothetical protein